MGKGICDCRISLIEENLMRVNAGSVLAAAQNGQQNGTHVASVQLLTDLTYIRAGIAPSY
jgi:hypothetical protein